MIKYLGSKRTLLPHILSSVKKHTDVSSVLDAFSGTSRVGKCLRENGYLVRSNDYSGYAATLAYAYVGSTDEDMRLATEVLPELQALKGKAGWFTDTYCVKSRFFQPFNGERIDVIRDHIDFLKLPHKTEAILLTSLMEAADRVDSTVGLQMAYLKQWAKRSFNPLDMRLPDVPVTNVAGYVTQVDAHVAVECTDCDLIYLDPPYNQHSYLGNYHIWESLVRWDKPDVYGVACKRADTRSQANKSDYNFKGKALSAFQTLVAAVPRDTTKVVLVSFSDEGYLKREGIVSTLETIGTVTVEEIDYKRYVGSQIGISNPQGVKVGEAGKARNTEYLFSCRL